MAMKTIERLLWGIAMDLAEQADTGYRRNIHDLKYLVGDVDGAGVYSNVRLAGESDYEYGQLIEPRHVPRNLTIEQLQRWFRYRLYRTPLAIIRDAA